MADALLDAGYPARGGRADPARPRGSPGRHRRPSTAGIVQFDNEGRLTFVNDRFCDIVGRPRDEVLLRPMEDIAHRDDARAGRAILADAWPPPGGTARSRRDTSGPAGTSVWASVSVSRIRGAGLPGGAALAVVDGDHGPQGGGSGARGAARARAAGAGGRGEAPTAPRTSSSPPCPTSCARPLNALRLWAGVLRQEPLEARHARQGDRHHRPQRRPAGAAHRRPARHLAHRLRQAPPGAAAPRAAGP